MADIRDAIHWWLYENCTNQKGKFTSLEALLDHFFNLADSLYYALENEPIDVVDILYIRTGREIEPIDKAIERVEQERFGRKIKSNKNLITIINKLSPRNLLRLRSRLALIGDMINMINGLEHLHKSLNNKELVKIIENHAESLKKYKDARNFFTHLDERIGKNIDTHGVTGELEIPEIELKFSKNAKGCIYFGFAGDTVYFHDKRMKNGEDKPSPKSLSFDKMGMADMFSLVKDLYDLVTSHSINAHDYPPSDSIYDLN